MGGFFPGKNYGGPPVSVDNFCSLMAEHECYIITYNHDMYETEVYQTIEQGWNDRGNCKVLYLSDAEYNYSTFKKKLLEIKPDVMYLQGLFQYCIVPCLKLAKKYDVPVLLCPRGELCDGAFSWNWISMLKKIVYIAYLKARGLIANINFQSTSEEETEGIIKRLNISSNRIHPLINIPSIPQEKYQRNDKIAGKARLVFLSRIHPKKNLEYVLNILKNSSNNVSLDIYGTIEDSTYWDECKRVIEECPQNISVKYCGIAEHDNVHRILSGYDAFIFPTLSENFGHVIAESLFAGTPVIISDTTPWNDVAKEGAGWVVSLDNTDGYVEAIERLVEMTNDEHQIMVNNAKSFVSQRTKIKEIKGEYNGVLCSLLQHKG